MKSSRFGRQKHGVLFLVLLTVFAVLEYFGHFAERGIGNYLKWQNHKRPQLGRIWEKDRQSLVAQTKIQSLRTTADLQERSADSIESFKQMFESVAPAFPLAVSRQKFLDLYYDYPGPWAERIISPYELIQIDARKNWSRVILKRFGPWITLGFLDMQGVSIQEKFLSVDNLFGIQSTRTVKRGRLEEVDFPEDKIFSIDEFLAIIATLDPDTQKGVFPEPRWFLEKGYHVTRVGVSDEFNDADTQHMIFGIEYDTDYYTGVLVIPVPLEIAYNMLSQIEKSEGDDSAQDALPLETPSGEIF